MHPYMSALMCPGACGCLLWQTEQREPRGIRSNLKALLSLIHLLASTSSDGSVLGTVVELGERNKLISVKPRETQTSSDSPQDRRQGQGVDCQAYRRGGGRGRGLI